MKVLRMSHKSIKELFRGKPELLESPEVCKLIDQYEDTTDKLIELTQNSQYNKENPLLDKIQDIYKGIKEVEKIEEESIRWPEFAKPNFRDLFLNLKSDLELFSRDYNIPLR